MFSFQVNEIKFRNDTFGYKCLVIYYNMNRYIKKIEYDNNLSPHSQLICKNVLCKVSQIIVLITFTFYRLINFKDE